MMPPRLNRRDSINQPSDSRVYVALPIVVIDSLLPTLKDTELRVLLVVLRQTWGWTTTDGQVKSMDWLAHSQLKARTGRASEAVSAAIDILIQRGLITVQDERGILLSSATSRRRCRGKMLFAPGPVLAPFHILSHQAKTGASKAKTTT